MFTAEVFPPASGLAVTSVSITPEVIAIAAASIAISAACPSCGAPSDRLHSRYIRTVADLPWQGRRVILRLAVRKFRCRTGGCARAVFCERLPAVLPPHARATERLSDVHRALGFALGGEAGARLAERLAVPTSPDTLLRRVRATGLPEAAAARVLGIDDFAFRKGQRYGTILVDLERRRVIDLLPDRESATLADWLRRHAGAEVVSRDRASAYAQAARDAAPGAAQVADRWHLLGNLRDAVEGVFQQRASAIRALLTDESATDAPAPATTALPPQARRGRRAEARHAGHRRRQELFECVRQMCRDGTSLRQIARTLRLHFNTVARYVSSDECPDWNPGRRGPRGLDAHADFIRQRLGDGCRAAAAIHRELQARGYRGASSVVRAYVRELRAEMGLPAARPSRPTSPRPAAPIPSPRRLAGMVIRRPADRPGDEKRVLDRLRTGDAATGEGIELAEAFAAALRERRGDAWDDWLSRAERSSVPGMRTFARGLRLDEAAVRAAFSSPWSNGQVEGQINRLKLTKRAMFGRASFDLLKARALHAA
jgi:transposase